MAWSDLIFERDAPPAATPKSAAVAVASNGTPASGAPAALDTDETYRTLHAQVFDRDTSYTKLTRTIAGFEGVLPDDPTRFKAALAALKANNVGPDEILRGLALHAQALESEKAEFERTAGTQDDALTQQRARVTELDGQIAAKQAEITTLTEQRAAADADAQARERKVADVRTRFAAAYDRLTQLIAADQDRITKAGVA